MHVMISFVYPPIPDRRFDWSATLDNYEGGDPIGLGATERLATRDLLAQVEDEILARRFRKDVCLDCGHGAYDEHDRPRHVVEVDRYGELVVRCCDQFGDYR